MSVQDFIADPKKYTNAHKMQFTHVAALTTPFASGMEETNRAHHADATGNWDSIEYGPEAGVYTDLGFDGDTLQGYVEANGAAVAPVHVRIGKGNMHFIHCKRTNVDRGIRFLPWSPNCVTYMELDAAATTFYTGPLSGCLISIARGPGNARWAFHANRNAAGANNVLKRAMTTTAIADAVHAVVANRHEAAFGVDYNNMGFVFGRRRPDGWKFYVVDTGVVPNVVPVRYQTTVTKLA
jgi:hypothetical protein